MPDLRTRGFWPITSSAEYPVRLGKAGVDPLEHALKVGDGNSVGGGFQRSFEQVQLRLGLLALGDVDVGAEMVFLAVDFDEVEVEAAEDAFAGACLEEYFPVADETVKLHLVVDALAGREIRGETDLDGGLADGQVARAFEKFLPGAVDLDHDAIGEGHQGNGKRGVIVDGEVPLLAFAQR